MGKIVARHSEQNLSMGQTLPMKRNDFKTMDIAGKSVPTVLNGKKILIESGGGVGDLIMYTPVLRRLKAMYPECTVTFLTDDKTAVLLSRLPYIDKIISFKRRKFLGRYRVLPELIKQDYLIFTEWQPHLLACAWLMRLPNRISIPRKGHFLTGTLHKQITHCVMKSADFAAETNALAIGEALGIKIDGDMTHCDVSLPLEQEKREAEQLLQAAGLNPDKPFIALSPFTSAVERDWPSPYVLQFIEMAEKMLGLPVLVIGPSQTDAEMQKLIKHNLLGKTTLMQLVAIIQKALLLVSPDSGPVHIAGAVGTSVVALFGRDIPSRWAPKYNCYPIYLNYTCSPCDADTMKHCQYALKCIRNISPEMVFEKISAILHTINRYEPPDTSQQDTSQRI